MLNQGICFRQVPCYILKGTHMNQSILEKPLERSGVYVIFNLLKKKVYVGETNDFYYRMIQHLTGIFGDGESTNTNLKKETDKAFEIFPAINSIFYARMYIFSYINLYHILCKIFTIS